MPPCLLSQFLAQLPLAAQLFYLRLKKRYASTCLSSFVLPSDLQIVPFMHAEMNIISLYDEPQVFPPQNQGKRPSVLCVSPIRAHGDGGGALVSLWDE